jgi:nucleotide-binding universal stress UspA family protein
MYKKILCPVDGSDTSHFGMLEAINLAKDQNAKIQFVHVIDNYIPIVDISGSPNYADMADILRENGKKVLENAENTAKSSNVICNIKLSESIMGQVSKSILDEAEECKADLIVMGTHGLRGFERIVMGSDAETIARTSPVPVLLVRNKTVSKGVNA